MLDADSEALQSPNPSPGASYGAEGDLWPEPETAMLASQMTALYAPYGQPGAQVLLQSAVRLGQGLIF